MNSRPHTLQEIAERSDSLAEFGRHLRDWLHEVRRVSSRAQAAAAIAGEEKRKVNAERQRRFRKARRKELAELRKLATSRSVRRT